MWKSYSDGGIYLIDASDKFYNRYSMPECEGSCPNCSWTAPQGEGQYWASTNFDFSETKIYKFFEETEPYKIVLGTLAAFFWTCIFYYSCKGFFCPGNPVKSEISGQQKDQEEEDEQKEEQQELVHSRTPVLLAPGPPEAQDVTPMAPGMLVPPAGELPSGPGNYPAAQGEVTAPQGALLGAQQMVAAPLAMQDGAQLVYPSATAAVPAD